MATAKQKQAARQNIKKAQETWQNMSSRQRSLAQPQGRNRAKPGEKSGGDYYRVVVRDKNQFTSFRNQDVGEPGGIQRVAGHRKSGSWSTQAWLISKDYAHDEEGELVADHEDSEGVLDRLESPPRHEKGDIYSAKPRRNVPEAEKPTKAQQEARQENIKKAQEARHT